MAAALAAGRGNLHERSPKPGGSAGPQDHRAALLGALKGGIKLKHRSITEVPDAADAEPVLELPKLKKSDKSVRRESLMVRELDLTK